MKLIIAVRDRAIDAFGQPIFVRSTGEAIRSFQDEINRPDSEMGKHPEDYDLYKLGAYNEHNGTFETQKPEQIAIGKDMIRN